MNDNKHVKKAMEIRSQEGFPNCAQSVLLTYANEMGLTDEQALALGANFGGGMKTGSVCGAVTSALMVLGILASDNPRAAAELQKRIKDNHDGMIDCADLLKANAAAGNPKKPHCDGMIAEAVALVDEILQA